MSLILKIMGGLIAALVLGVIWALTLGPAAPLRDYLVGVAKPEGQIIARVPEEGLTHYIYTPPGFEDGKEDLPLILHLHGAFPGPAAIGQRMAEMDARALGRQLEAIGVRAVIVSPYDGYGYSMWSDNADGTKPVQSWILDTLVPGVEAEFGVGGAREERFVQGFSMGGFGAMKLGLAHPEKLAQITSWDGALHNWETLTSTRGFIADGVFDGQQENFDAGSPWSESAKLTPSDAPRLLFFTGQMDAPSKYGAAFMKHLQSSGIQFAFKEADCPHDLFCFMTDENVRSVYGKDG